MTVAAAPDILRAAGVQVVVEDTWNLTPLGEFPAAAPVIVWHHDASPAGASPGALDWIKNAYRAQDPSAQFWVDTQGVWHCIGRGLAWHAGKVLPGMPGNYQAVGVETDHTVGEDWPDALLTSLRRGTAALLKEWGHTAQLGLWFHKQICDPPGRKSDPDGLDIGQERDAVQRLMFPPIVSPSTPSSPSTDPTAPEVDVTPDQIQAAVVAALNSPQGQLAVKKALDDRLRVQFGNAEDANSILNRGFGRRVRAEMRAALRDFLGGKK